MSEDIKNLINNLIYAHALQTKVSSDQNGLRKNQLRVYRDYDDSTREYFIVTIKREVTK